MKSRSLILEWTFLLLGLVGLALAKEVVSDPYLILGEHFEAVGGLDQLKAQKTTYQEGTIVIEGAGLKGKFKQWSERPLKVRQEIDLKVVNTSSGDNGEFSWEVDPNGKILIKRDEATSKERTVRKLMAQYEHLDRKSQYFTITLEGSEKIEDKDCYVVKITNNINDDIEFYYFDKSDFYLLKTVVIKPDIEHQVYYSDFRKVDGMIVPFREVTITMPTGEKSIVEYKNYVFNKVTDPALFEPPQQDVKDFEFINGKSAENMPFEFIEDHLYLPVNLRGKEQLWVLDCGAGVNVIDSSLAAELGLAFEGPIKGQGASGVVNIYFVTLPAYTIGTIKFEEQKVVALSLREMFHKALGLDVVGILGYDFLSRFVTKIDFAKQTISFYDPATFEYAGKGTIFDSPLQSNMLSLPVTVDSKYSGRMRLDIGAPDLDFHYPYAKNHDLLSRKGIDVKVGDAAGLTISRISQYETIEVGGYVLENPVIGTPHEEGTGSFADETAIGNIGNSFSRNFILYLDYSNQRVILEKGADFGRNFPRAKSGLQFYYNTDNNVEVIFVAPHTPADEAGFKQGDIIISVNGIGVEYFDGIIALRKLMKAEAGITYVIEVLRGDKLLKKQLTLRDLF